MSLVTHLMALIMPAYRRKFGVLLALMILNAVFEVAGIASIMPFVAVLVNPDIVFASAFGDFVAALMSQLGFKNQILFLGCVVGFALLLSMIVKLVNMYLLFKFTFNQEQVIGCELFSRYLRQKYEWYLGASSGDLTKTVLSEVEVVVHGSLISVLFLVTYSIVSVAILGLLFYVDPMTSLLAATGLGGSYCVVYLALRSRIRDLGYRRLQANEERFRIFSDTFGSIKLIKTYGLEQKPIALYVGPARAYANSLALEQILGQMPRYLLELIAIVGLIGLILYWVISGQQFQDILPLVALFGLAGYRLMPMLQQIYFHATRLRFGYPALVALSKQFQSLVLPHTTINHANIEFDEKLEFRKVSFSYPEADKPVIDKLNLSIEAGSMIAFVGPSGVGKTTIIDLMLGLFQAQNGEIWVDDRRLEQETLRSWQKQVGYVPQDAMIIDATLRENLTFYADANAGKDPRLWDLLETVSLREHIEENMPQGLDSQLGEGGVKLSGGQRQRLALARGLVGEPNLLILDEATSALDGQTEAKVLESLSKVRRGKTTILITHSHRALRFCDQVFEFSAEGLTEKLKTA